MPVPASVMPWAPLMTPPTVRVLAAATAMVGVARRVTAPVPRFKAWVPAKAKLPFQFIGLWARVMPATVL